MSNEQLLFVEYNSFEYAPYYAICVNDITSSIFSDCVLFADNLKIFRIINGAPNFP